MNKPTEEAKREAITKAEQFLDDLTASRWEEAAGQLGPVIGAHCGPGTVAICFFGKERPC